MDYSTGCADGPHDRGVRCLLSDLRDGQGRARIQARIDRAAAGNLGTFAPVGDGVSELKIDVGHGYRVYFVQRGLESIILLAGGDKSTQVKDVALAKELARQL